MFSAGTHSDLSFSHHVFIGLQVEREGFPHLSDAIKEHLHLHHVFLIALFELNVWPHTHTHTNTDPVKNSFKPIIKRWVCVALRICTRVIVVMHWGTFFSLFWVKFSTKTKLKRIAGFYICIVHKSGPSFGVVSYRALHLKWAALKKIVFSFEKSNAVWFKTAGKFERWVVRYNFNTLYVCI